MAASASCRKLHSTRSAWPGLRLVRGGAVVRKRGSARRHSSACKPIGSSARQTAHCRQGFQIACVLLAVACGIAMARVALVVQATEASLEANMLKQDIENEMIRGEALEADRSALEMPSRIRSIAGVSMGMDSATEVSYLSIPASVVDGETDGEVEQGRAAAESSERLARVLASVMRMTAGEAQVLLVGDAGLASSR